MRLTFRSLNQQVHLYTKGMEFMDEDGNEYVGEYHYSQNKPYTGPIHSPESKLLLLYNSNKSIIYYDKVKPDKKKIKEYVSPYDSAIGPLDPQYDLGFFVRYFVKRYDDINNTIYEISPGMAKLYGKPSGIDPILYQLTKMNWYITKDSKKRTAVELENSKTLRMANLEMPGLVNHISGLFEYSFEVI